MKLKKILLFTIIIIVILCLFVARIIISKGKSFTIADKPSSTKENVISWEDAGQYYGRIMTVEGEIVAAYNTGEVCFLNFHKNWKQYFTAVIFSSDFTKFPVPPDEYYLFKKVRVKGLIKEYKDKPEIIVKNPSQIEIIR